MECPNCHFENPSNSTFCSKCGTQILSPEVFPVSSTKTAITPIKDLTAGTVFAERYEIVEKLGKGGMGVVYKAEDTKLKRTVALKFLRAEFTSDPEAKERFINEAQAAAALDHPNICTVYEIDKYKGLQFISMAYIGGQSLNDKIKSGPLKLDEVIDIAIQFAEGLQTAHERGIIHRDIKCANIMITDKNQAKIMDFGLAKLAEGSNITKTTKVMGTLAYMSPEQASGEPVDSRTDIWSFGVVMYEMLTGELPFKRQSEHLVIYSILNQNPRPIKRLCGEVPGDFEAIVNKCLEKKVSRRYQTIADLKSDLKRVKQNLSLVKDSIRKASAPWFFLFNKLRQRIGVVLGVVFLMFLLFLGVSPTGQRVRRSLGLEKTVSEKQEPAVASPEMYVKAFKINEILQNGEIVKINSGKENQIEQGDTGKIYYLKETEQEKIRWYIAQFVVKEVMSDESRIEITEKKEQIKSEHLIEFDKVPRGLLIVDTEPDEADIYIDNEHKGKGDLKLILNPAKYRVSIKAEKYQEKTDEVKIEPRITLAKTYRLFPLLSQLGTLKINSVPPGAEIYLWNRKKSEGKTPFQKSLRPGRYRVKVKMNDYEDFIQEMEVKADKITSKTFSLNLKNGIINIGSEPQGAEVYFGDSNIPEGISPLKKNLPSGVYEVRIRKEGFKDISDEIRLQPGGKFEKIYTLDKLLTQDYTLVINTFPEEATVTINNKKREEKTPIKLKLASPQVLLRIEKEHFKVIEERLDLNEEITVKNYNLEALGKGHFIITAYPNATVEIDGKPIEGKVPPQRIVEVLEGEHKIKFIFEEYGEVEKVEEIGNEETNRIHCTIEDHPQLFSKKCTYELGAYPKASIEIDGKSLGEVPPIKHRKVSVGKHKISFVLRDNSQEYVDIELNDSIEIKTDKKIHLVADVLDFEKQENSYLATEDLLKSDKDWIVIKSNHEIQVEINGIVKSEVSLLKDLKLQEIQKNKHRIKLILQRSNEDYRVEINIFKIVKMKHQKVKIAIEML